ncbi:MAG: SDR family oxidoreductase [Acidimicrobiales bacterium]|nr:SDR family oxidoreductase [Acidimicrobiales bacterium]
MDGPLQGRRVLVTGAARGIGAGIAAHLAAEGATIAVLDRPSNTLGAMLADLGSGHVYRGVDLADPKASRTAVAEVVEELGGLDALVNNAGIFEKVALEAITVEQWDRMLAVNARAPLVLMQACLDALADSGRGRIVSVASMGAKLAAPLEAHYAASKAALMALTRAAAVEWGPRGITVNAVSPGYVLTEMGAAERSAADVAAWSARSPLGRLGSPQDVAGVVSFLLSDAASYLTGQTIDVAGGMVMS